MGCIVQGTHACSKELCPRTHHLRYNVIAALRALQTGVKQRGKYSLYSKLIIRFIYEISALGIFLAEAIYGKKEGSFRT
jgi:hypothetical protein